MSDDPRDQAALVRPPTAAEREAAVERLSDAFAQDVLALEEFERRVATAYRAASTQDLVRLLADLPAPTVSEETIPGGVAIAAPLVSMPPRIAAIFANVERNGPLEVPSRLDIRSYFGNVELDLSAAQFAPGVTEISIRAFCGNVELSVPTGAVVENYGSGILASFTSRAPAPGESAGAPPSIVRLRITGWAALGNVEIDARPSTAELSLPPLRRISRQ
jgi:hypothetical protein